MHEIPDKENLRVIFREDTEEYLSGAIFDDVVALANTEGGVLYIGTDASGHPAGLRDGQLRPGTLAAGIAAFTVPPVSLGAELVGEEPAVLKITVPRSPDGLTATKDGRVLRRRQYAGGQTGNVPVYPCDLAAGTTGLYQADFTAMPLRTASTDDFDPMHIERLRWTIETNTEDHTIRELPDTELFQVLGMVAPADGGLHPTVTGLLLAGRFEALRTYLPDAAMRFVVTKGTSVQLDEEDIMPIPAAIEKLTFATHVWNPNHEMRLGLYRKKVPDFDEDAVLEALVNAFLHRDYTQSGMVEVRIADEGMTVSNPGALREGVDASNIFAAQPYTRNPQLSRALRRIGLKGSTKRGIDRIYEGALQYGSLLPEYSSPHAGQIRLFLPRIRPDKDVISLVTNYRSEFGHTLSIPALLIINALREMPRARVHEVAELTHLTQAVTRTALGQLIQQGLVEVRESASGRSYRLTASIPGRLPTAEEDDRPLAQDPPAEIILDLVREKEFVTNAEVTEILGISSSRAYRLLKRLLDAELLERINKGRYAKYRLRRS